MSQGGSPYPDLPTAVATPLKSEAAVAMKFSTGQSQEKSRPQENSSGTSVENGAQGGTSGPVVTAVRAVGANLVGFGVELDARGGREANRVAQQRVREEDAALREGNRNASVYSVGLQKSAAAFSDETPEAARTASQIAALRVKDEAARVNKSAYWGGNEDEAVEARCIVRVEVPKGAQEGGYLSVKLVKGGLMSADDGTPQRVNVEIPPGCPPGSILEAVVCYRTAREAEVLAKMARLRVEADAKLKAEAQEYEYRPDTGKEYEYRPAQAGEEEYVYKG